MRYMGYLKALEKLKRTILPISKQYLKDNLQTLKTSCPSRPSPFKWDLLYELDPRRIQLYYSGCNRMQRNSYRVPYVSLKNHFSISSPEKIYFFFRMTIRFIHACGHILYSTEGLFHLDPQFIDYLEMRHHTKKFLEMRNSFIQAVNHYLCEPCVNANNINTVGVFRSLFNACLYTRQRQFKVINIFVLILFTLQILFFDRIWKIF